MKKTFLILSLVASFLANAQENQSKNNLPDEDLDYIYGIQNPEDLVSIPQTKWIIASGMAPNSGLHLINTETKTAEKWAFSIEERNVTGLTSYPTAPNPNELQAHGISLRKVGKGKYWLYVVNHGGKEPFSDLAKAKNKETIEIFQVDARQEKPQLHWVSNVALPEGLVGNAVVSDKKGNIFVSVAMHPDNSFMDIWGKKPTGAIYRWTRETQKFEKMQGTERVGNNGVEISKDGKSLFVVHMHGVSKLSTTEPVKLIKEVKNDYGMGDNIHWVGKNLVIAASRLENCPETGADFSCMKGYHLSTIHPKTLKVKTILKGENTEAFSGVSVGLPMNGMLYLGTFHGDKVAFRSINRRNLYKNILERE